MRQFAITLLIIITAHVGLGQDTAFYYSIGTIGDEEVVRMMETDSSYIIFGSTGYIGAGNSDIYLCELNKDFTSPEFRTFGTGGIEKLVEVVSDDQGRYFLISLSYTGFTGSGYDLRIDKLGQDLTIQDSYTHIVQGDDYPVAAAGSADEIFILLENDARGYSVVHFSTDLELVNSVPIPSEDSLSLNGIYIQGDSAIYLVGDARSISGDDLDQLIIELDTSLAIINEHLIGTPDGDELGASIGTFLGGSSFLVVGSSNGFKEDDFDAYVSLYDLNASDTVWQRAHGWNPQANNQDEFGVNCFLGFDSTLYLGLTTNTYGQGGADYHVYRLNSSGNYMQGNSYGLSGDEELVQLFQLADSSFVLVGNSNSSEIGGSDILLVHIKSLASNPFRVYTNFRDSTTISDQQLSTPIRLHAPYKLRLVQKPEGLFVIGSEEILEANIYDISGRLMYTFPSGFYDQILIPSGIQNGVVEIRHRSQEVSSVVFIQVH